MGIFPELVKIVYKHEPVVGPVASHSPRVFIDDFLDLREPVSDLNDFIHLLLIVAENDTDIQVFENTADFIREAGLINGG